MSAIKRNIPNLITLANLACGLLSIVMAFQSDLFLAGGFVFLGSLLDFFDGLSARLLNVSSKIGKQLDSFADMVTFGVAPGIIIYTLILEDYNNYELLPYIAFLIPIFSAIRLSKFNIDTRQSSSFIGLPTPAAAIFIASLPVINQSYGTKFSLELLIGISVVLSFLLVAEIPLFSLKIKSGEDLKSKENKIRILFLISSVILLFIIHFAAIPFIVILYIFLSTLNNLIKWNLEPK